MPVACLAAGELVHCHSEDDHHPDHNQLSVCRDSHECASVTQEADEQGAYDGSRDGPAASGETGAANKPPRQ